MNVQELASELATKNFRPLYAIVGEESFMAERASALLLQALQANASDGTSTHRYNGNEIKTGDEKREFKRDLQPTLSIRCKVRP